jgi:nucleoside-diphosphate-sugar epimerase
MAVSLITGGAGFMGSHLADALVARGDAVRVLDNFSTGTLGNLSQVKDRIEAIAGDLNDPQILRRATKDVEYVFHFMAPAFDTAVGSELAAAKWANALDTFNVLVAAREAKVRRVIFASSGQVYGHRSAAELNEHEPTMPVWPMGFAKQTGENQCAGFTMLYGIETVSLRFFDVFGPRQSPGTHYAPSIPAILGNMVACQNPVIAESPFRQQDFLYIADAVHATLLAAETPRVAGKAYNIARGRNASLAQVVSAANEILGTNYQPLFTNLRPLAEQVRTVSIARAEAELGFCPSNDLKQGVNRFIDFLQPQAAVSHMPPPNSAPAGFQPPHFLKRDRACSPSGIAK